VPEPAQPPDPTPPGRAFRRTAALGAALTALGLLCLAAGVAGLAWWVLRPDEAVLLPPGLHTPPPTPSPGSLGSPVAPPPLPEEPLALAILPVNERATATPPPTPTHRAEATSAAPPPPTASPTARPPAAPDRIVIEAIGLDAPVVPVGQHLVQIDGRTVAQWDVPATFAAGWHQDSATLGEPGNTVINGHHNANGEVFRDLVQLQPGDIVRLDAAGTRYWYEVAQTMVLAEEGQPLDVRQANARWILPTTDERVTLITCWPYESNSHRLVVIALPVPLPGGAPG